EPPPCQLQLRALGVQVPDRLVHEPGGSCPHTGSAVQHAVDRGVADPRLAGDLPDRVAVGHFGSPDLVREHSGTDRPGAVPSRAVPEPIPAGLAEYSAEGFLREMGIAWHRGKRKAGPARGP